MQQLASHPFPRGKPLVGAQIDWTSPYNKGAKSCWLFNEGCGFRVADIVGGNHGTFTAGTAGHYPEWSGGVNTGVRFKGANEGYIKLNVEKTLYSGIHYTALVWFRPAFQSVKDTGQALVAGTGGSIVMGIDGYNKLYYGSRTSADRLFPDRDYVGVCKSDGSNTETLWVNGGIQGYGTGSTDRGIYTFGVEPGYSVYYEGKIYLVRVWDRALLANEIRSLSINPYLGILAPRSTSYFIRCGKAWSATFPSSTVVTGAAYRRLGMRASFAGSSTIAATAYRMRGLRATSAGSTLVSARQSGQVYPTATVAGSTTITATMGFKVSVSATLAGSTTVAAAAKVSKIPPYVWDLPVFSFEPDWSQRPKLGMTFITDLHTSDAGSEERNARLDRPKLTQEHVVSAWDDHDIARQIELFIESNMGEAVLVPMWSEAVTLTAAPSGTTIPISDDATARLFQPTRAVMLWKSPSVYSLVEITAAGANSLTTLNTVPAGYAAGDIAVPVFVSDPIQTGVELDWLNAFHASGKSSWQEAAVESETLPMVTTLAEYRDIPIFPFPFNWARGFFTQRSQRIDTVASETSIISAITAESDPRITAPGSVWLDDRSDIARAWTLFCDRRGRQSRLWLPSGKRDLVLAAAQSATSNQLVCTPSGYVTGDYLREQRRVLLIVADGAWHARRVTGAEFDAYGHEVLTLESTVPALPADAVISMLLLTRFDVDDISLTFNHNSQSDWETKLAELPGEYAVLLTGVDPADGVLADNNVLLPTP